MRILRTVGVFLLWNIAAGGLVVLLPFPYGLIGALAFYGWLLKGYLLRGGPGEARRRAALRLRPLRAEPLRWTLLAIPVLLLLSWSLGDVYTRLVPVPTETLNPFESIMRTATGRLTIAVFAIGVAPVVEEFVFRGFVQRELERRHGPALGITLAAVLFAVVHFLPWVFPLHFVLGFAFGFAVYATRSIWSGVILHAANNTAAVIGFGLGEEEIEPTGGFWSTGPTAELYVSLGMLAGALLLAAWLGSRLWAAGRPERLRDRGAVI